MCVCLLFNLDRPYVLWCYIEVSGCVCACVCVSYVGGPDGKDILSATHTRKGKIAGTSDEIVQTS